MGVDAGGAAAHASHAARPGVESRPCRRTRAVPTATHTPPTACIPPPLLKRYDAVVHMVTAADGAEPFYTLDNNAVRTEGVAKAIEMDRRTLDCWTGHEHLYIVDNS